jgi:hypothetical protein
MADPRAKTPDLRRSWTLALFEPVIWGEQPWTGLRPSPRTPDCGKPLRGRRLARVSPAYDRGLTLVAGRLQEVVTMLEGAARHPDTARGW